MLTTLFEVKRFLNQDNQNFGQEYDEALNQQDNGFQIQPAFIVGMSLKELIRVCGNEFNESVLLYNNEGVVTQRIPDMLEAFENSVEFLACALGKYTPDELRLERKGERDERRTAAFNLLRKCFAVSVDINLMPGIEADLVEIIGYTKKEHDAWEKTHND